ncbi:MAG TPA: CvpA family protein [Rhizomicrobium sp.]|nr:CvpA family protein [Rhizomicrobium sp.]
MNLTFVDILVGLVLAVSTFYAVWRGFLHETLSIFALVAAGFAALYLGPWLLPWIRQHITTLWLAIVATDAAVFLVVYVPLAFLSRRISNAVRGSAIGPLDRILGIAFGVIRGLAIVGLAYIGFVYYVPTHDHPSSLTHARTLPLMQMTAGVLHALVPNRYFGAFTAHPRDQLGDLIRRNEEPVKAAAEEKPENIEVPQDHMPHKSISAARSEKGYGAKDRRALDSLVEATGNGGSGKP